VRNFAFVVDETAAFAEASAWREKMSNQLVGWGDDGSWPEIVGEQTRGGSGNTDTLTPVLGNMTPEQAYQVMGAMAAQSPAFAAYTQKKFANSRPMIHSRPLQAARDWQIDFGPVSGAAGTTTTITQQPQCLFRGEKIMATDSGTPAGTGTRVGQILIGQRLQRPAGVGATLTAFFANNALGNGIKWDTCDKALSISLTVSFIQSCTFDCTVFGKAVV
jgi:hypothetical protein